MGVGLVVLGALAFVGVIVIAVSLPLLPLLMIPLFIVWLFCAMLRKGKGAEKGIEDGLPLCFSQRIWYNGEAFGLESRRWRVEQ